MLRSLKLLALATASLAVAVAGSSCSDDNNNGSTTTPPATTPPTTTGSAELRIIHASPDAPAVDIWIEGQAAPLVRAAKYGDATPYVKLGAGTYNIQIRPAGAPATDAPVYATGPIAVPANARITAIAVGLLNGTTDADKLRVLALPEAWKSAPDKATVRVVHASADAPTVGLDVGDDDPSKPEVASLARFADTGADGIQLPAGQALQVGVVAGAARVTAFTTPTLSPGSEVFVIATGLIGKLPRENEGFALLAVGPQGSFGFIRQNPTVYALHASPDAPAVDLFVGPKEVANDLRFGAISAPIQVPPGAYTVDFFATAPGAERPAGAPAASSRTPELTAGGRYLAAATGFLVRADAANKFTLVAEPEGFDLTAPSRAVLRGWHLSPDAPAVDVGVITDGTIMPVFPGLVYTRASAAPGVAVEPAALPIGIAPAGKTNEILFSFNVPATAGMRAYAVVAGAAAPQTGEQALRLLVVETKATPWTVTSLEASK